MKLSELTQYTTGTNIILGLVGLAIVGWGLTCAQSSCGKKHDLGAVIAETQADDHAKELADLKQQLSGKETEIASTKSQALTWKQKYEAAKAKIPPAPLPPPVGQPELENGLKKLGLGDGLVVQVGVPSIMSVVDAQVVWVMGEEAKRAKSLDEALIACAQAVTASESVVKAQGEGLELSARALRQSQAEAAARQVQANELAKSLKVEKQKRWQRYAWGIGGAVLVGLVKE